MNYKNISIVFIIILLPIMVVLSTYMQNQIDTLSLSSSYKKVLIDSTYDAVMAYESNTMSPTVAVGEDKKRYVLASVNTFFNSLATNMGISGTDKIELQSYVPAMLFTCYDGYYIYSPVKMKEVMTDNNGIAQITNKGEIDQSENDTYNYIVKPFVYYSANYSYDNKYDVVINYSLDNYIAVYGRVKDSHGNWNDFNKSGYFIDYNNVVLDGNLYMKTVLGNSDGGGVISDVTTQDVSKTYSEMEKYINNYSEMYNEGSLYNYDKDSKRRYQTGDEIIRYSLENHDSDITVKYDGLTITDIDAKEYYIKAYYFSKWVNENLGDIVNAGDINNVLDGNASGITEQIRDDLTGNGKFLKIENSNNPENESSNFNQHKRLVIKNSIIYSLNSAISTYDDNMKNSSTSYDLPVLLDKDWDKILSNISMTVFMQGLPCGSKYFNDYTTVTSDKSNQFVDKNNLVFTKELGVQTKDSYDDYHRIDCPELLFNNAGNPENSTVNADLIAEFKYDARKVTVLSNDNSVTKWDENSPKKDFLSTYNNNLALYDSLSNTYYNIDGTIKTESKTQLKNSYKFEVIVQGTGDQMEAYLFDHKNTKCYECIVTDNYEPVVEFDDDGQMVLSKYVDDNEENRNELKARKYIWYTNIAKYRNKLYKFSSYINR
ncbi:MAG: hypothetical protein IKF52_05115 [Clostridia bacterium]|nr:hypothetical protein [Clostridia bacterium]